MPGSITDVDEFPVVQHITDGDPLNSGAFSNEMQLLANRTRHLANRVVGAGVAGSDSVSVPLPMAYPAHASGAPTWEFDGANLVFAQVTLSTAAYLVWGLPYPNAALVSFEVTIDPAPGHGGLPAVMPQVELGYVGTGGPTIIDTQVDASGSVGAYEAEHTITLTLGSPEAIDNAARQYFVRLRGESSTNSVAGTTLTLARAVFESA